MSVTWILYVLQCFQKCCSEYFLLFQCLSDELIIFLLFSVIQRFNDGQICIILKTIMLTWNCVFLFCHPWTLQPSFKYPIQFKVNISFWDSRTGLKGYYKKEDTLWNMETSFIMDTWAAQKGYYGNRWIPIFSENQFLHITIDISMFCILQLS